MGVQRLASLVRLIFPATNPILQVTFKLKAALSISHQRTRYLFYLHMDCKPRHAKYKFSTLCSGTAVRSSRMLIRLVLMMVSNQANWLKAFTPSLVRSESVSMVEVKLSKSIRV